MSPSFISEDSLDRHLAPLLLAFILLNNGFQVMGIAQESHTGRKERLKLVCHEGICQTTMQDTEAELVTGAVVDRTTP